MRAIRFGIASTAWADGGQLASGGDIVVAGSSATATARVGVPVRSGCTVELIPDFARAAPQAVPRCAVPGECPIEGNREFSSRITVADFENILRAPQQYSVPVK